MQVLVNSDNHVEGREKLIDHVESMVRDAVERRENAVTHVEVHLEDVNGSENSGGDDKRCTFEARVAGWNNFVVNHQARTLHLEIEGAADKLTKALDSALGKLQGRQRLAAAVQILRANVGGCRYLPLSGRRGGRQFLQTAPSSTSSRVSVLVSITIAGHRPAPCSAN